MAAAPAPVPALRGPDTTSARSRPTRAGYALSEEDGGDHAQVGGLSEGFAVRVFFGGEFEAARLRLTGLPSADGDGLVRLEHPFARVGRGGIAGIDGVEAIDRSATAARTP